MRAIVTTSVMACMTAASLRSADVEPFDLKKPPLPEPGQKYRLVIEPGKKAKPITLLFIADEETRMDPTDESSGKSWTGISSIVQVGVGELAVGTQPGVVHVEVEDYDGDGYLDFRIPTTWGTGGTWYEYFRYNGKRYVSWKQPGELGINHIDPKTKTATASARSGPSHRTTFFKLVDRRFIATAREVYDQAKHVRELVPRHIADDDYALIEEELKKGKVVKRRVTKKNPWADQPK